MIGYLEGKVVCMMQQSVIVNVNGVGYKVLIGEEGFREGDDIKLFVHTNVQENAITLIGFRTEQELKMFSMLIEINGVGPKIAVKLVTSLGVENIAQAINREDAKMLKISGVGQKTASRIIIELKDKVTKSFPKFSNQSMNFELGLSQQMVDEAVEGLKTLGYREIEVRAALNEVKYDDSIKDAQGLIKMLLRHLK